MFTSRRQSSDRFVRRIPREEQALNRVKREMLHSYIDSLYTSSTQHNQDVQHGKIKGDIIDLSVFGVLHGMVDGRKLHTHNGVDTAFYHMVRTHA